MTTYFDASVILRIVLGQPDALDGWVDLQPCVASRLAEVECFRTLDRVRLEQRIDDETMSLVLATTLRLLRGVELIEASPRLLREASRPMPLVLGTLDAIHLTTAVAWRDQQGDDDLLLATHDDALGRAARSQGLHVIGV